MAFVGHRMSLMEQRYGLLTKLVCLVVWALRRLRRYTTFARDIQVVVATQAEAVLVADPVAHMRLRALVVDMQ